MRISQMIQELQNIQEEHGDLECCIEQTHPREILKDELLTWTDVVFIVPEQFNAEEVLPDNGWQVSIRSWPY